MRLKTQLFDSRVARRIFTLFLLASLIPLFALSALLIDRVGRALEAQAVAQLEDATRGFGQVTLDKLLAAAEALSAVDSVAKDRPPQRAASLEAVVQLSNGAATPLLGQWHVAPGALASMAARGERPSVAALPGDGPEVIVGVRDGDGTALFGSVDREYLWRTTALLADGMDVCVLAPGGAPIYCTAPLPEAAVDRLRAALEASSAGRADWSQDDDQFIATYWQLFLPSRFDAEPWTIVVSQPRDVALASLGVFNQVVPAAALVTLALIIVLATTQIRRTLTPLDALLAGTKRIAGQKFDTPVEIKTADEFGTLGNALNSMASQLSHQFAALRALADIDRLILQTASIETVLETLLARLREVVPGHEHSVLMLDPDDPSHGRLFRRRRDASITLERIRVSAALRDWLGGAPAGRDVRAAVLASHGLPMNVGRDRGRACIAPMLSGKTVTGALLAIDASGAPSDARALESLCELAARVAVAVAAGEREAELFKRAHFDSLTGLPNRELLDDRLRQAVAQAQREEQRLAVLFVDLDGFKDINDTLGHRSGDDLLKETGLRLTSVLRHADTVARLGGDEYALVLPQIHGSLEAEAVALKALEALRRPFVIDERQAFVTASIGVAIFPEDGSSATELLRKADMAMYSAKDAGKNCYRFFAEEMDRQLQERHSLHLDLRNALFDEQLSLAYQPQSEFRSRRVVSVEALLRWRHPTRGILSPALFIPILEETGLINDVGTWVLRKALADFATWRRLGLQLDRMAVNVSTRQLHDPAFVATVVEALASAGLKGRHLEVELTEASLIEDFAATNATLKALGEHGVRVALDDFGTGYSSLAYLNELAFDTLKIDRAFVVNLPAEKATAVARAIIAVAKSLGKHVVAEGIETESQYGQLDGLGCDFAQGYLLSKPLDAGALVGWLSEQTSELPMAAGGETSRIWLGALRDRS
jgi:diguanylate cyclase (GGDEF)-like protein